MGVKEPNPLRTEEEPYGVKGLNGQDAVRVKSANLLVEFMGDVIPHLQARKVFWTIENPWRSIIWNTKEMNDLMELKGVFDVKVDMWSAGCVLYMLL